MEKVEVKEIIKTSIITAFTIAAALIWKDVIVDFINVVIPPSNQLVYKLLAAILATIFVVIAIFLVVKTEDEAEYVVKRFRHKDVIAESPKQ